MQDANPISTVLVVEDESELLALIARILRESGHKVLEAHNPNEAIFVCEHTDVDLILSDFNMPGTNGIKFAEKVKILRPNLPMLFMSGNREACDELAGRGFLCLRKPFSFAEMEHVVREMLGDRKSTQSKPQRLRIQA